MSARLPKEQEQRPEQQERRLSLLEVTDQQEETWKSLDFFNHSHSGRLSQCWQLERAMSVTQDSDESDLEDEDGANCQDFVIPELPKGQKLLLRLLSTWGDPFYVGLNGIEIFTNQGIRTSIKDISSHCDASLVVPDYARVENLLKSSFRTHDDTRLWLAPFSTNEPAIINMEFDQENCIAMIRIWNYNRSRVHSSRGVRLLEMVLDDTIIFRGEISQAVRSQQADECGDTILFTTDESILDKIALNDHSILQTSHDVDITENGKQNSNKIQRPATGDEDTKTLVRQENAIDGCHRFSLCHTYSMDGDFYVVKTNMVTLEFRDNWGCSDFIGLTGLQLIGRQGAILNINANMCQCTTPSRMIDKLFNGRNLSTNPNDMWLVERNEGQPVRLTINFGELTAVTGISFWNYNGCPEMTYAGVSLLNLYADDKLIIGDLQLRKASGHLYYDYVQEAFFDGRDCHFSEPHGVLNGFVYQIQLLSTWGDEFYLGLNGIDVLDANDQSITIGLQNLAAYPESVNILPKVNDDPRNSSKLIDGMNNTNDAHHMWLAPILPHEINRIFLIFDEPISIAKLRIWNYRKTPNRGVREINILIDDIIVYSGEIQPSTPTETSYLEIPLSQL